MIIGFLLLNYYKSIIHVISIEQLLAKKLNLPASAGAQMLCREITAFQSGFERSQPFFIGGLFMFQQNGTKFKTLIVKPLTTKKNS